MNSHEYAGKLRELAAQLEAAPSFKLPNYSTDHYRNSGLENLRYYEEKEPFLAAVRAIGKGRKVVDDRYYNFVVADGLLHLSVNREAVCRIVKPAQPAEYDCEPLLSQAEEAQLTTL